MYDLSDVLGKCTTSSTSIWSAVSPRYRYCKFSGASTRVDRQALAPFLKGIWYRNGIRSDQHRNARNIGLKGLSEATVSMVRPSLGSYSVVGRARAKDHLIALRLCRVLGSPLRPCIHLIKIFANRQHGLAIVFTDVRLAIPPEGSMLPSMRGMDDVRRSLNLLSPSPAALTSQRFDPPRSFYGAL